MEVERQRIPQKEPNIFLVICMFILCRFRPPLTSYLEINRPAWAMKILRLDRSDSDQIPTEPILSGDSN